MGFMLWEEAKYERYFYSSALLHILAFGNKATNVLREQRNLDDLMARCPLCFKRILYAVVYRYLRVGSFHSKISNYNFSYTKTFRKYEND